MDRPERLTDLLGYMDTIIRASQKFSWPACVEYDVKFRQMAAGDEKRQWAALDGSLYTECFTGQTLNEDGDGPSGGRHRKSKPRQPGLCQVQQVQRGLQIWYQMQVYPQLQQLQRPSPGVRMRAGMAKLEAKIDRKAGRILEHMGVAVCNHRPAD